MGYLHHFLLGVFKTISHVVQWLVGGNGVLGSSRLGGFEGKEFRDVAHSVLELPKGGKETGPIRLQSSVLATHSELNGEPVALSRNGKLL